MHRRDINIAEPCRANWDAMKRGDKSRFCADCKKHVQDLTSMSSDEASALLAAPATEGLCVRYLYDENGRIAFRDSVPVSALTRLKRFALATATLAAPMTLNACMGAYQPEPPPPPPPVEQQVGPEIATDPAEEPALDPSQPETPEDPPSIATDPQ